MVVVDEAAIDEDCAAIVELCSAIDDFQAFRVRENGVLVLMREKSDGVNDEINSLYFEKILYILKNLSVHIRIKCEVVKLSKTWAPLPLQKL